MKNNKQRLEKYSERFDNKDNELAEGIFNPDTWGKRVVEEHIDILYMGQIPPKEETKQETLEEAAERHDYTLGVEYCAFIEGAKWKQEQDKKMYSEEDMKEAFKNGAFKWRMHSGGKCFEEFIDQNKKN